MTATALTVGYKPNFAREKITIGKVVEPGQEKKAESTTSSSEIVNVNNHAEIKDWEIIGKVTR